MNNIMLASSCQNRISSWKQGLTSLGSTALIKDELIGKKLDTLKHNIARIKPQILLLDYDLLGLAGTREIANIRNLCVDTKIIILTGEISEEIEWELVKAGISGYCRHDIKPELLHTIVSAVQNGELWVRRTLISRLIDELGKTTLKCNIDRTSLGFLNKLTQREYDIAVLVGNGQSNKQIALACAITERTVKAHLTEVYFKLGVTDRLNLALFLSANDRSGSVHSDIPLGGGLVQVMHPNSANAINVAANRRLNA